MKRVEIRFFIALFVTAFLLTIDLYSQVDLPINQDPDKCYARASSTAVFESYLEDYLTYSKEESEIYAHDFTVILLKPEWKEWKYKSIDEIGSPFVTGGGNVLVLFSHPATYDTLYIPIDDKKGNPYYREIEFFELVEEGGEILDWVEIDCSLINYITVDFIFSNKESVLTDEARSIIYDEIYLVVSQNEGANFEVASYTDTRGDSETNLELTITRANEIVNYLCELGIERRRILPIGFGETKILNNCQDGVLCPDYLHEENNRIQFRAVSFPR